MPVRKIACRKSTPKQLLVRGFHLNSFVRYASFHVKKGIVPEDKITAVA
jgi:hypothetical protein